MNAFELFAKLGIDTKEYEEGLDNAEGKGRSFASKVGGVIGKGVQVGAAAAAAATTAAVSGITALTTQAVSAYGEYEQLVGGVQKIFGDSAAAVMQNADEAFATAGMSANEYMETVTGFSAALINSLDGDTETAASLADQAIRDMSDNANTFGSDMESIMNAYSGFSRQNFTMLDNLKLGFSGSAEGAKQLLEQAEKLDSSFKAQRDSSGELTLSYADMVEGIHIVQENMNIAGTTAKEASGTITGSAGSLSAAWQNLIAGLGNAEVDLAPLIDSVVNSFLQMVDNIKPIAEQAINGISSLIQGFAPIIAEELPPLVNEIIPVLGNAAVLLITSLTEVVPTLTSTISNIITQLLPVFIQMLPVISQSVFSLIMALVDWLGDGNNVQMLIDGVLSLTMQLVDQFTTILPILLPAIVQIISQVAIELTKPENTNMILNAIIQIIGAVVVAIWNSLPAIFELIGGTLVNIGSTLLGWFSENVSTVTGFFGNIWELLTTKLAEIWQKIVDFFSPFIEFISPILESVRYLFDTIFEAIRVLVSRAFDRIKSTFTTVWNAIYNFISPIINSIKNTISNAFNSLVNLVSTPLNNLKNAITNVFNSIKITITNLGKSALTWGKDLIDNFVSGIRSKISSVSSAITGVADKIRSIIGFSEPEEGPLSVFHTFAPDMIDLFTEGLYDGKKKIETAFDEILRTPEVEQQVEISNGAVAPSLPSISTLGNANITVNVYGAEGQDIKALAKEVSNEIQNLINSRGNVYA